METKSWSRPCVPRTAQPGARRCERKRSQLEGGEDDERDRSIDSQPPEPTDHSEKNKGDSPKRSVGRDPAGDREELCEERAKAGPRNSSPEHHAQVAEEGRGRSGKGGSQ